MCIKVIKPRLYLFSILIIMMIFSLINSQHEMHSSSHATLKGKSVENIPQDSNTKKMVLQFNQYEIPAKHTTYACKNIDVVKELQKATGKKPGTAYHAIAYHPVIDQTEYLHHLIVLSCDEDIKISDEIYECPMIGTRGCTKVLFGWALGSGDFILPQNVGILWGVAENKKVVMQFHYNNPDKVAGVKDSSGINIFYTSKLRKFDSAVMVLGAPLELISIPPKQKSFKVENTCPESCFSKIKESIYVFAFFLHGHTHLKKIRTEIHYADGTIDNTTFRDDNYSFDHQKNVMLDKPIKISAGDQLKTICEYDTSKSDKVVKGGESTTDEMCDSFLSFFPRERGLATCIAGMDEQYGCNKYETFLRKKTSAGKLKKTKRN